MKILLDRSHAPAWECSPGRSSVLHGAPLARRKQHVPRWSVGTIKKSLLATEITEGTEMKTRTTLKDEFISVCSVSSVAKIFLTRQG